MSTSEVLKARAGSKTAAGQAVTTERKIVKRSKYIILRMRDWIWLGGELEE